MKKKAISEVHGRMAPREDQATVSREQLMKMLADSDDSTTSFKFTVASKQLDVSEDADFKAASVERYKELVAEKRKRKIREISETVGKFKRYFMAIFFVVLYRFLNSCTTLRILGRWSIWTRGFQGRDSVWNFLS